MPKPLRLVKILDISSQVKNLYCNLSQSKPNLRAVLRGWAMAADLPIPYLPQRSW